MTTDTEQPSGAVAAPTRATPAWVASSWVFLPALATTVVSAVLAGRRAVWLDEAVTVYRVAMPWDEWLHGTAWGSLHTQDAVHGLYYVVLRVFEHAAGLDLTSLRLFSALSMGLACAAVVAMAWQTLGRRAAFLAGLAFALLPVVADYGTEARSFALATCMGAWTSFVFLRVARSQRVRVLGWAAYALLLTVTGYVFLYAWVVAVAHLVAAVLARDGWRKIAALVAAQTVSVALMLPLLRLVRQQTGQVGWVVLDLPQHLHDSLTWPFGTRPGTTTLVVAVAAWLLLLGATALSARAVWADRDLTRLLATAWAWVLVLPGALIVLSLSHPTFVARYLVPAVPAVAVLLGFALSRLRRLPVLVVAVAACLVVGAVRTSTVMAPEGRDRWGPRLAVIQEHARRGDAVLASPRLYEPVPVVGGMPRRVTLLRLPDDPWPVLRLDGRRIVTPEDRPRRIWIVPRRDFEPADVALVQSWGYQQVKSHYVGWGAHVLVFRRVEG